PEYTRRSPSGSTDGPSRARTGDLLHAMQALSQLSYGPVVRQSSGEFVVLGPVDQALLVVQRRRQTQLYRAPVHGETAWKQVAGIKIGAVNRDRVDLVFLVAASDESVRPTPTALAMDCQHVASTNGPLALNTQEPVVQIEYQVIDSILSWSRDDHAEDQCRLRDRGLGDRTFLVRCHLATLAQPPDARSPNGQR